MTPASDPPPTGETGPGWDQGVLPWADEQEQTQPMDDPAPSAPTAPAGGTGPAPAPAGWHRFTAASPLGDRLPTDVASYGADIPSEPTLKLLGNLDGKRVL